LFKEQTMPRYSVIHAELELITPGFIGGASHEPQGIDPKSIKSALRQWWRALNSSHIAHHASTDQAPLLAALHKDEMRLFGEEGKQGSQGQSMVQVVLRHLASAPAPRPASQQPPLPSTTPGITYLLGQGLFDHKTGVSRIALAPCKFALDIIFFQPNNAPLAVQDRQQVLAALYAFGMLGGLGSRQNRGFGSVALRSLDGQPFLPAIADYLAALRALFDGHPPALPLLPAFSGQARCRVVQPADARIEVPALKKDGQHPANRKRLVDTADAWSLLAAVGEQFMLERSWGHYDRDRKLHLTNGRMEAEQNYKSDHHLIKAALGDRDYTEETRHSIPQRSIYGLPYFFGKGVGMNLLLGEGADQVATRRSSPFHIHITTIDGQALAVLYSLPSRFVPAHAHAYLSMGRLQPREASKVNFDYAVIERFLQRFTAAHIIA
jgi:hypothetical protein